MKKGSSIKDSTSVSSNLEWNIYLKSHVLCMRMMTIVELIQFFEYVLYIYVAWLSGVLLGYLLGVRSGGD